MKPVINILDMRATGNMWAPPEMTLGEIHQMMEEAALDINVYQGIDYLHIFKTEPYIDALCFTDYGGAIKRFAIHPDYVWSGETEDYFEKHCIKDMHCVASGVKLDKIYKAYSAMHPSWNLKRYRTKGVRLLDHIYSCTKGNTVKGILYMAGLDELAAHIDEMDELNLLASTPSHIYAGLNMKVLRSLNSSAGAKLLCSAYGRDFIKVLDYRFPALFFEKLNDAQCNYLLTLINGGLNCWEVGNIMQEKNNEFRRVWNRSSFAIFMKKEAHYGSLASKAIDNTDARR